MTDEKTQEAEQGTAQDKPEDTAEVKDDGDTPKDETFDEEAEDLIKDAVTAAKTIKEENDRREKLQEEVKKILVRKEALKALGGGSPAGDVPDKPKEETPLEYSKRVMAGDVKKE